MARIVLGMGLSHSPQVSLPGTSWAEYGARDAGHFDLYFRRKKYPYADLVKLREPEAIADEINEASFKKKDDRVQKAMAGLSATMDKAKPDVVVIIGDDHHELYKETNMPAMAVYWGPTVESIPRPKEKIFPPMLPAAWALYGDEKETWKCDPKLGEHLIVQLIKSNFDIAQVREQDEGISIGHPYIVVRQRIMHRGQTPLPILPVIINTYFPPNVPTPGRCYAFGRALRAAIEAYPEDLRVAVVASGGLSHFVVDPKLDQQLLNLMKAKDVDAIGELSPADFVSGSSESLCWLALAGASEHLKMETLDYVPGFRSLAGTGCGMAFAHWQ